jgi:hypothetical protein
VRYIGDGSSEAERESFFAGTNALRLTTIHPQQLWTADALNCGRRFVVVLEPRRSSKTTSITAWALGRCLSRADYKVGVVYGTTGKAARDAFLLDVVPKLEGSYPDQDSRPFKLKRGAGQERIEFANGSLYQVCSSPEDFRGRAFDVIIFEEAGELEGDRAADMLAAASPTQDTVPEPITVVTGTAGKSRAGNLLWDFLERLRAEDPDVGGIEYSAGVDLVPEDWETWELAEPLVLASHPGVGTLMPDVSRVRANYGSMRPVVFGREYLGIFSDETATVGLIAPAKWADAELTADLPEPPERFAVAFAAHPYQSSAAIAAAWRVDGIGFVALLDHREGVRWLAGRIGELGAKYPATEFGHDSRGVVTTEVEAVKRDYPSVRLAPQNTANVTTAAALFVREVHTGNVRHYGQSQLTEAVLTVRRREIGQAFAFGRPGGDGDIVAAEAASLALRLYDEAPMPMQLPQMVAT